MGLEPETIELVAIGPSQKHALEQGLDRQCVEQIAHLCLDRFDPNPYSEANLESPPLNFLQ